MNKVGEFEKVSYQQYLEAMKDEFYPGRFAPDFEDFEKVIRSLYEYIELPKRATSGSAGYDIKSPMSFVLEPGETIKIPTGLRVRIDEGWFLMCVPRSSLGFKYRLQLANTLGIIDAGVII